MDRIKIIILALTLTFVGCKKEEVIQVEEQKVNCFCGDVELQTIAYSGPSQIRFCVYFSRNHCTNAIYRFETPNLYTEKEYCLNYQW